MSKKTGLFLLVVIIILIAVYTIFVLVNNARIDMEYNAFLNNPDQHIGQVVHLKGQTYKVEDKGADEYAMYVFTRKKEYEYDDDLIYVNSYTGKDIKNDQVISFKAQMVGITTFTKKNGEQIKIPEFEQAQ